MMVKQSKTPGLILAVVFFTMSHPIWAANLCSLLLFTEEQPGEHLTADLLFSRLTNAAFDGFVARRSLFTEKPYAKLTEMATDGGSMHSIVGNIDSRWLLEKPSSEQNIWHRLETRERLLLMDLLEEAFSIGRYDDALTEDQANVFTAALCRKLVQPTLHALAKRDGFEWGFSPLLFLGAAIAGANIGICRHVNLALAGILIELGMPGEDLRVITGFEALEASDGHMFLELRAATGLPWFTYDATPKKNGRSDTLQMEQRLTATLPLYQSGSMNSTYRLSVDELVTVRSIRNSRAALRRRFGFKQMEHSDFSISEEKMRDPCASMSVSTISSETLGATYHKLYGNRAGLSPSPNMVLIVCEVER